MFLMRPQTTQVFRKPHALKHTRADTLAFCCHRNAGFGVDSNQAADRMSHVVPRRLHSGVNVKQRNTVSKYNTHFF